MSITPFKISIPDAELDLLSRKLELTRLPTHIANQQWSEDNGVSIKLVRETVDFWRKTYNWRDQEAKLNRIPQFKTHIDVDGGFGTLDIHFAHSKSSQSNAIPLLFVHGWPGSFIEIEKALPDLNAAGFHVVAPSLPGYGFSSYTDKPGFKHAQHAEVMHKIMTNLGYHKYVIQGGDWGSFIVRNMALMYPDNVMMAKPKLDAEPSYTPCEQACLQRLKWFSETNSAYSNIQSTKPLTLGFAMHDSPVGMLAWMADKLLLWTDNYPWTPTEMITWTLMHYFPGPTTGFNMYHENPPLEIITKIADTYVKVPSGASAFPKELGMMPRSWAEKSGNFVFWQEHQTGGHFAAYEKPQELVEDMVKFYKSVWKD